MHRGTVRLIGRSSRLSVLQLEIVKEKIQNSFPELAVEIIARSSRGDDLQNIPLHTVEGSDFFTQDIFDALANGEADIAVHSLKDMSGEHFFGANKFAVVDRDDVRDVAIFNSDIIEKITAGKKIVIGTCSPRREEMAIGFLKKALPQLGKEIIIEIKSIRGNVETRLRKLQEGDEYDATILATAGLNRLLRSDADAPLIKSLLAEKKIMLLPLIECVPAPCQGAIVAEAHVGNAKAVSILQAINNSPLAKDCYTEKKDAIKYGAGCIQKFGVTTIQTLNESYLYAAGIDAEGTIFSKWNPLPEATIKGSLFSSTDVMKDFFVYKWREEVININTQAVFVANYKAVQNRKDIIANKTVFASGTKTWFELAKQGYWVTASADGLGFEFLLPSLSMPLLNFEITDVTMVTHESAAKRWQQKGYNAVSNYSLIPKENEPLQLSIAAADFIFWSSFSQFEFFGRFAKPDAKHLCAGGETAALLKQQGLSPIIFPTIKAFELWRNSFTPLHSVA
jgi:hydroxymethylbilane synthase